MNFAFTEDQEMIRKSARDFAKGQSSIERVRGLLKDERGYSPELWKQIAAQGWLGTAFPEQYGGAELGCVDLICILEELGQGLLPEPIIDGAILPGNVLLFGCNETHKSTVLPQILGGEVLAALAGYELAGRFNPAHVETTAKSSGDGFVLDGSKSFVPNAASADKLIVSARTSGKPGEAEGITLFLLDRATPGITLTRVSTMDRRARFTVDLKGVKVGGDRIVGSLGKGLPVLEKALDRATVALCAEMLGGMDKALTMSVAYAKERVQFGKPIGSFQAIKHKCANMFVALETARSATYYAAMATDDGLPDMRAAISCAKALCSDHYLQITKDAIQIHGGIGFTDECDIHLYYKRAIVSGVTFGDASWHRDRYATEKGF